MWYFICRIEARRRRRWMLALDISNKVGIPTSFSDQFSYHIVLSDCYMKLQLLDKAELHIKKLDELETKAEAIRGPMRRSEVDARFAYLFMERKQYRKARDFLINDSLLPDLWTAPWRVALRHTNR